MTKHQALVKRAMRTGGVALGILVIFGAIWYVVGVQVSSQEKAKATAENSANGVQGQIASLQSQLDKSGNAEKGYLQLSNIRTSMDFVADSNALKEFLRLSKKLYRFSSSFKLSVSQDKPAAPQGVSSLNYDVTVRPGMKLELEAMSDYHVFAFLDEMQRAAPGMIRIDGLTLKRRSDILASTVADMQRGSAPMQVEATIQFTWIGVAPKAEKASATPVNGNGAGN